MSVLIQVNVNLIVSHQRFACLHYSLGIEDLCTKRDELQKQIINEEEEKAKIQNDIRILSERLAKINESLAKKIASRNEYDKTIAETEAAYMKVNLNFPKHHCHQPSFNYKEGPQ